MKYTVLLSLAAATLSQAKPGSFTYNGIVTENGGVKCSGTIQYTIMDDAGGPNHDGHYEIDGCPEGETTYDDGTFTLVFDRDEKTSSMKENSSGLVIEGGDEGEHRSPVVPCKPPAACPIATTKTCIFGSGPDGTEPATKDCGLT